jgi:hypothetical protein
VVLESTTDLGLLYIKNRWSMSFPDALPEVWLIEHGHYYEEYDYKVVDAITN